MSVMSIAMWTAKLLHPSNLANFLKHWENWREGWFSIPSIVDFERIKESILQCIFFCQQSVQRHNRVNEITGEVRVCLCQETWVNCLTFALLVLSRGHRYSKQFVHSNNDSYLHIQGNHTTSRAIAEWNPTSTTPLQCRSQCRPMICSKRMQIVVIHQTCRARPQALAHSFTPSSSSHYPIYIHALSPYDLADVVGAKPFSDFSMEVHSKLSYEWKSKQEARKTSIERKAFMISAL